MAERRHPEGYHQPPAPASDEEREELEELADELEEREELADELDEDGRHLAEVAFAMRCNKIWKLAARVIRAAALLRQPAPVAVPADLTPTRYLHSASGAAIERTRTRPDTWAVRRGSERMSTCGRWSIEPRPSDRTGGYLVEHSFPSPQAALAVLQHWKPPQSREMQP